MKAYDVIVIGAGVAGLSCAKALKASGRNVLVLEAQDYIGGRVKTDRIHGVMELGAEFVHGEHAVTWEIIRDENLVTEPWSFKGMSDYRVYGEEGRIRPDSKELMAAMYAAEEGIEECTDTELSVGSYLDSIDVPEEVRFYSKRHIGDIEGADPEVLCATGLAKSYRLATNGEENFRILDGYDRIPETLARGLDIHINHGVTRIEWKKGIVKVECENGANFRASRLVVTAPVGVMQKEMIAFSPDLPSDFTEAMSRIGYGDNAKIIFLLKGNMPEFRMIDTKGAYGHFWQQKKEDLTMVIGYSGGLRATELTKLGSEKAIQLGIGDLADALGSDIRDRIEYARFCSWSDNPYILGSYSYPKLGIGNAREVIREPIAETIYYTGEATHTKGHASTVHGAIEEGRSAAARILESI